MLRAFFLIGLAAVIVVYAVTVHMNAQSILDQILAAMYGIVAAVLFSGAFIIDQLEVLRRDHDS